MLNPSTATFGGTENDDPTIRRCISFAERELMSGLIVTNLFAWRSTNPRGLLEPGDPVGSKNLDAIRWALTHSHRALAVVAWGRLSPAKVGKLAIEVVRHVRETITSEGFVPLHCLGRTKMAPQQPRHPLMLASNTTLERWP